MTRDFKSTIMNRAAKDKKFLDAMLSAGVKEMRFGDIEAGKAMLRDLFNSGLSKIKEGL